MDKKPFSVLVAVVVNQQRWRYLHILQHLTLCFACLYHHVATAAVDSTATTSHTLISHHDLMAIHDGMALIDHVGIRDHAITDSLALLAIHDGIAAEEKAPPVARTPKNTDPLERSNRRVHNLNERFDRAILKPVAKAYRFMVPKFLRRAIANVFRNIAEAPGMANKLAQGKPRAVARGALRFLINSTLGAGGLFDLASRMRLKYEYEDFGQTLAVWGVGSGPYIVLPFFGPNTVRGGVGRVVEIIISPFSVFSGLLAFNLIEQVSVQGLAVISQRVALLSVEFVVTGDKYEFYRNAYLQRRDYLIHDGVPTSDAFLDDDF